METHVYRISSILAGQSADVTVVGRDAAGRELQLELPRTQAHALQAGRLLILHLSAHVVPELEQRELTPEARAAAPEVPAETDAPEAPAVTTVITTTVEKAAVDDEAEVYRMLGLA